MSRLIDSPMAAITQAITLITAVLAPIQSTMLAVSALVIIDTVTGVWAAKKRNEKITSFRFSDVIGKTIAYHLVIFSSYLMETYFLPEIPVVRVAAGLIGTTEFKSLLENITDITGVSVWDLLLEKIKIKKRDLAEHIQKPVKKTRATRKKVKK